jgi:polyisoprenoid-binding protein YceI
MEQYIPKMPGIEWDARAILVSEKETTILVKSIRRSALSLGVLAAVTTAGTARASDWEIDPAHTTATFAVRHLMVSTVKGSFENVSGTVNLDEANPARSTVEIAIDAASVNTRNGARDGHLKSPDFFDVAQHPKLVFKATKIAKAGKDRFKVVGDLTMRGVTKPVTLDVEGPTPPVKDMMGRMVRGVVARGKLNRKDWGLVWNKALEGGGVLVSDEVQLEVNAEMFEKGSAPKPKTAAAPAPNPNTVKQ